MMRTILKQTFFPIHRAAMGATGASLVRAARQLGLLVSQTALVLSLVTACGQARANNSVVLLKDAEKTAERPADDLQTTLRKDEGRSAKVLVRALCGAEAVAAAWAAVHALRLGIRVDEKCASRALGLGIKSKDTLLQALCWRRLIPRTDASFSEVSGNPSEEPVVDLMAALAFARHGNLPENLRSVLAVPTKPPDGLVRSDFIRKRTKQLFIMALPYDDGPLALAVAFVEARDQEILEIGPKGKPQWSARRLRQELLAALKVKDDGFDTEMVGPKDDKDAKQSFLSAKLELPLTFNSGQALRAMALTGDTALRRDALRAIAAYVQNPTVGDFAAAAAALDHPDSMLRIEAARTFLLLSLRARHAD
jgi:hypothetical protein